MLSLLAVWMEASSLHERKFVMKPKDFEETIEAYYQLALERERQHEERLRQLEALELEEEYPDTEFTYA